MRIVIVRSTGIDPDPRVEKEAYSLGNAGHSVEIIGWDRAKNHEFITGEIRSYGQYTKVHRVGIKGVYGGRWRNLASLIKFQFKIAQWLWNNRKNYDCIHACDLNTGATAYFMAKLLKKKLVYDIFDYYPEAYDIPSRLKRIVAWVEDLVIYGADAVIICTEQRKKQIHYHGDLNKLYIIHNSPIIPKFDFLKKEHDKKRTKIVYVGILQKNRYIEELLDLVSSRSDLELEIGGFGILEPLVKKMADRCDRIHFYGKMKYEDTLKLEESSDIMTALYRYNEEHRYAAPNKFYEALMLGKPVIMEKNTGMDKWITQNNIGCVIGENVDNLESAVDYLISRKQEWDKISVTMKELYHTYFSWQIMEERLKFLYANIE